MTTPLPTSPSEAPGFTNVVCSASVPNGNRTGFAYRFLPGGSVASGGSATPSILFSVSPILLALQPTGNPFPGAAGALAGHTPGDPGPFFREAAT